LQCLDTQIKVAIFEPGTVNIVDKEIQRVYPSLFVYQKFENMMEPVIISLVYVRLKESSFSVGMGSDAAMAIPDLGNALTSWS
jgi:hypothetical protein